MNTFITAGVIDSLEDIRQYIDALALRVKLTEQQTFHLKISVIEIATNIISYGYQAMDNPADLQFAVEMNEKMLTLTIIDDAPAFNPLTHKLNCDLCAPLEEREIGGLGIYMAKKSVDSFLWKYENGQNKNIFVIKL
jgi:anti-sigma regulatory factor (Ser/Thr protein kinase)